MLQYVICSHQVEEARTFRKNDGGPRSGEFDEIVEFSSEDLKAGFDDGFRGQSTSSFDANRKRARFLAERDQIRMFGEDLDAFHAKSAAARIFHVYDGIFELVHLRRATGDEHGHFLWGERVHFVLVDLDVRVGADSNGNGRRPLCMVSTHSFTRYCSQFDVLVLGELGDDDVSQYRELLRSISFANELAGSHGHSVVSALYVEVIRDRALVTRTCAITFLNNSSAKSLDPA